MKKINTTTIRLFIAVIATISISSCDDFVQVDSPRTELIQKTVFEDDGTAEAAMVDIYYGMKSTGFASGSSTSISLLTSLSSDEQNYYSTSSAPIYLQFNNSELHADNLYVNSLWSDMYRTIFKANSIIEGLSGSTTISDDVNNRLQGEAKFIRAFCNFYLVNLWGDVPLIMGTDYKKNNMAPRAAVAEVYNQIVLDLQDAISVLPDTYDVSKGERVRANKWTAVALLSRVHLYTEQWAKAEEMATLLIDNTALFALEPDLELVFRKTSPEVIFQLWSNTYPEDRNSFAVYSFGPLYGAMRSDYVATYEDNDQRWTTWGTNVDVEGTIYPGYFKYWDYSEPPLDYSTVFRLAEQYLIRAEARLKQQKLDDARHDIDAIRNRAGLPDTSSATEEELFDDIVNERKAEFATEWGHRWFDLKRWKIADEILGPIKEGWSSTDVLYPIPETQIINNPTIDQNPG